MLRLAEKGHNILLTGFPGTGKTKLVIIVNKLHLVGRRVAVTSKTGISSSVRTAKIRHLFTDDSYVRSVDSKTGGSQMRTL